MKLTATALAGLVIVEPTVFADSRGWFMESFNEARFRQSLGEMSLPNDVAFVQDNHSCSNRGVLRGLHYQLAPHAQGKLVRVVQGSAFDVAVDIRRHSATFGQWVGVTLSAENRRQFWIPAGFAHGFIALQDETHFLYKTTDYYAQACERSIRWNDSTIGIDWPDTGGVPVLAGKDAAAPLLAEADTF